MVITPETLHISKSLGKTLRSNQFTIKINSNFKRVIHHCKSIKRKEQDSTWIDKAMVQAYTELHTQGVWAIPKHWIIFTIPRKNTLLISTNQSLRRQITANCNQAIWLI
jgi:hypothetical protein